MAKAGMVKLKLEFEGGQARPPLDVKLQGIPQQEDRLFLDGDEYVVEQTSTLWQLSTVPRKKRITGERLIVVKCRAVQTKQKGPKLGRPLAGGDTDPE
jgi:hypothetical protein